MTDARTMREGKFKVGDVVRVTFSNETTLLGQYGRVVRSFPDPLQCGETVEVLLNGHNTRLYHERFIEKID